MSFNMEVMPFLEKYAKERDYPVTKINKNELSLKVPGAYIEYEVLTFYFQEYDILYFSCDFGVSMEEELFQEIASVIFEVNERIWVGHFDRMSDTKKIVFSLSIPMVSNVDIDENYIDEILCNIIFETDRFYPCFAKSNLTKDDLKLALCSTMFESVGTA